MDIGKTTDRQEKKGDAQDVNHFNQSQMHRIGGEFMTNGWQSDSDRRKHEWGQKLYGGYDPEGGGRGDFRFIHRASSFQQGACGDF